MRVLRQPLCLCLVLVVTGLLPTAGQTPDRSVAAYRTIVDDYRRNGHSAVQLVIDYTDREIAAAAGAAVSSAAGVDAWPWEELRGAAMLHTEAALDLAQRHRVEAADVHLQAAARLLDAVVTRSAAQRDFSYRWHVAVVNMLRYLDMSRLADPISRQLKDRFGRDRARAWFEEGVDDELRGCGETNLLSVLRSGRLAITSNAPARWWIPAARAFQDALAVDPTLLQAALHLGRLRMIEDRVDDAVPLLEKAVEAVDPRVGYLAVLFLGSIAERRGAFGEAEARYRDAIGRYPSGQASQLALAELLSRTGRELDARTLLLERFGREGDPIVEPLWTYLANPARNSDRRQAAWALGALFDELRVEVWR